jgi:hypothetical protein
MCDQQAARRMQHGQPACAVRTALLGQQYGCQVAWQQRVYRGGLQLTGDMLHCALAKQKQGWHPHFGQLPVCSWTEGSNMFKSLLSWS